MRRFILSVLFVATILAGFWALYNKDQIKNPGDAFRLARTQITQLQTSNSQLAPWQQRTEVVRIASFDVNQLGTPQLQNPRFIRALAEIIRQFDVVAVQNLAAHDSIFMKRFVKIINEQGRLFRSASDVGTDRAIQSAFLYDTNTIALEGERSYAVHDPDKLFQRTPLVAWFRCTQAEASQAFTFSVVNVHLDSKNVAKEIASLGQLFRAVRNDGRSEDDIIIAGNLWAGDQELSELSTRHGLNWLINQQPTNTVGTHQLDNLIIDPLATSEFTGETGVFDFMKQFNLTQQDASQISTHLPVWGEFSVYENNASPQFARSKQPGQLQGSF